MDLGKVSVVIPAHNEGENVVDAVRYILQNSDYADLEVVVVDDGSTDGSGERIATLFSSTGQVTVLRGDALGAGGARNYGARQSNGDIVVFLDGHCYVPRGWLPRLVAPLGNPRVGMVGPAFADLSRDDGARGVGVTWRDAGLNMEWLAPQGDTPHPVPLLPGGCQAMRREDFERFGEFEPRMTRWGSEGEEQSLRVWLMGYDVVVEPRAIVYHLFRETHPYPVEFDDVLFNRLLTATIHFRWERAARVLDYYKDSPGFSKLIVLLMQSDVLERRREWQLQRVHDDDWFCARFGCAI